MPLLEACVESLAAAEAAWRAGAGRIELCAAIEQQGLTPDLAELARVVARVDLPVVCLVRPRAGGYCYAADEFSAIESTIDAAKAAGAAGIAVGVLDALRCIDRERTARLVERARPLPLTFHRAFDQVTDQANALEILIDLGVARVLSSGGAETAWLGRERLRELVARAAGRITVIAGGKVREDHAAELMQLTGVREVHGSVAFRV
jgi:copper homeostasis protein